MPEGFWEGPPTLAVNIISPQDRADDIHEKLREYLDAGTRQVWVLWPRRRFMTVYDTDGQRELGSNDQLDGGDVLPGFHAPVSSLFAVRRQR